ncbi:hypothetical protein CYMTET_5021 [Cymbomonas tetramitiformis]|uniref:Kinesin motor domain-containing protein n=1 Tax=Cymbomonas tetramitiformis TaxID=36881 RepID=A0AAE0H010_9CHLO|nr:hypothetical protein CYMTET_5021 [Cymbomonas tetramitiformis]
MGGGNNVLVAVRCRPMSEREKEKGASPCVESEDDKMTVTDKASGEQRQFSFDYCYMSSGIASDLPDEQAKIYQVLGTEVLNQAYQGYNVTVMAYGQTGSGKSLTMVGRPSAAGQDCRGLIPRISEGIFNPEVPAGEGMVLAKVELQMLEIYNEQVRDLLAGPGGSSVVKVREDPASGPYVEGLTKHTVLVYEDVCEKLEVGLQARTIAGTKMNAGSSRAHTICQLHITRTNLTSTSRARAIDTSSLINLVDLAGSERVAEAGTADNVVRIKESVNINKSLTALGQCIRALSEGRADSKHVPYRDSQLTWLLKNSLGGNAKTIMVAAVAPGSSEYAETLSTLRYADRMRKVQTAAVVNRRSVATIPVIIEDPAPQPVIEEGDEEASSQGSPRLPICC